MEYTNSNNTQHAIRTAHGQRYAVRQFLIVVLTAASIVIVAGLSAAIKEGRF